LLRRAGYALASISRRPRLVDALEPVDQDAIDCLSDACIDVLNALKYSYAGTYPTLRITTHKPR
jgi:hypothetical protein